MNSRHLPLPSPNRPSKWAAPASNCWAVIAVAVPLGKVKPTFPSGGGLPASSRPLIEMFAGALEGLMSRSLLTCRLLLAGLKNTTSCRPLDWGTTAFMPVRKPSVVRT